MTDPLEAWIAGWKKTREFDRKEAKKYPYYKDWVKQDTRIIQRLVRKRNQIARKFPK